MNQAEAIEILRLIQYITDSETLPQFGKLKSNEHNFKIDNEIVTQFDLAIEQRLHAHLKSIYPHAIFLGEELTPGIAHDFPHAFTADHSWIIDPIDGTRNFVRGDDFFCTMVALQERGATVAAWIYAPALGLSAYAVGDGPPVFSGPVCDKVTRNSSALDVVTTHPLFWSQSDRNLFEQAFEHPVPFRPSRCAGIEYLALAAGHSRGLIFTWDKPWDHVPGLFLLAASGGAHRCADGELYTSRGGNCMPLVAARNLSEVEVIGQLLACA